jgi:hypothetical protein
VDKGESFQKAVKRETEEEGGVNLDDIAIVRVEHNPDWKELRILFVGASNDEPKSKPDDESLEAVWESINNIKPTTYRPRDREWIDAIKAIDAGAKYYPPSLLMEHVDSPVWSLSNAPDPWHFTSVAVIVHEGKVLVRINF